MAAIRCGQTIRDNDEMRTRAARIATGLAEHGVTAGDRVAIFLHNDVTLIETSIGAGILGAVPVPVNWHWKGAELGYLLDDSDSRGSSRIWTWSRPPKPCSVTAC